MPFTARNCLPFRYFADLPESRAFSYRDLLNGNFILGSSLSYVGGVGTKGDQPASGLVCRLHVSLVLSLPRVSRLPLSQLFPPNPSGQSQLKEPHRLTQVPPFRHGLVLQKCLLAEHPGMRAGRGEKNRVKRQCSETQWGPNTALASGRGSPFVNFTGNVTKHVKKLNQHLECFFFYLRFNLCFRKIMAIFLSCCFMLPHIVLLQCRPQLGCLSVPSASLLESRSFVYYLGQRRKPIIDFH